MCQKMSISNEDKIEYMIQYLDRCTTLIGNCDNKASIMLSVAGVMLSILFSNEKMILACQSNCWMAAGVILLALGMIFHGWVIFSRVKGNFLVKGLQCMNSESDYQKYLENQIDENAKIFQRKYTLCNCGICSVLLCVVCFALGVIL